MRKKTKRHLTVKSHNTCQCFKVVTKFFFAVNFHKHVVVKKNKFKFNSVDMTEKD